jgi:hypothetical protein
MNSTIPSLQSLIARNRNEISSYSEELLHVKHYYKYLSEHPNYDNWEEKEAVNHVRECKLQIASLERIQKVSKALLAREYAEERLRAFNKECQRMRNK